jgi:hypothetical protein
MHRNKLNKTTPPTIRREGLFVIKHGFLFYEGRLLFLLFDQEEPEGEADEGGACDGSDYDAGYCSAGKTVIGGRLRR